MTIEEVISKKQRKEFLAVPKILYRKDPFWVCPLDREIEAVFHPSKNPFHAHGSVTRYLLKDDAAKLIGRIAVFIDEKSAYTHDQPTGGIGFFECINDQGAANLLFDTAKSWLIERKMEAMDGPINFGETDKYWGLLVEGFMHPAYEIAYNFPYYLDLFSHYGFQTYYNQEGFHLDITKPLPERFTKIAEWIAKKPEYTFEHFEWKKMHKHVHDFTEVFNQAWASFKENFEPIQPSYIIETLKKARAIIEEEFVWIAYHNQKPVAIYLMYPDLNQILKHLDGRMHIINMIKFLYLKKRKTMTRARGVLMGVIPQFQGRGIEAAIILNLQEMFKRKKHFTQIEFSWVGDFNPKMKNIFLSVGSVSAKHYKTLRYLFDREKPFKRYPLPETE
ncbi:GNAT family N-acetyltransferase [Bacteroidota bacterium]